MALRVLCFSFCKTLLMLQLRINSPCLHLQQHAHYYDYGTAVSFRNLYNSEYFFLACWRIHFGRVLTFSFYPIPLTGWRSLSLSAKWLCSPLFHPCFPPILHTRAWVRESDTSEEREENGRKRSREGERSRHEDGWRDELINISEKPEKMWPDPSFLCAWNAVIKRTQKRQSR